MATITCDQVFISYSHLDKEWLEKLRTMLKPLERAGRLTVWADTEIGTGQRWRQEIENALARLVRARKTLLVLDGLEPLQYPPGFEDAQEGRLKEPGMQALLRELAIDNPGLCVLTSREAVADLAAPAITGLTEALVGLSEAEWRYAVSTLREAGLVAKPDPAAPDTLDAHPLVREHFGARLQVDEAC